MCISVLWGRRWRWLMVVTLCAVPAGTFADTASIIARVDKKEALAGTQIRVVFTRPLRYIAHLPRSEGTKLTIRLRPANDDRGGYQGSQVLPQSPSIGIPLTKVSYNSPSGDQASLVLEFDRQVLYEVEGRRLSSIVVTLPSIVVKGVAPEALPVAPSDVDLAGHYVVNLASSNKAVPFWRVSHHRLFDRYRLYTQKARIDGEIWERLRLGFFVDKSAARKALKELEEVYPAAWIAKIPQREKTLSVRTIVTPGLSESDDQEPQAATVVRQPAEPGRWYALNLETRDEAFDFDTLTRSETFKLDLVYLAETSTAGGRRHSLRLGFFDSVADARDAAKSLADRYPNTRIVRVTQEERSAALDRRQERVQLAAAGTAAASTAAAGTAAAGTAAAGTASTAPAGTRADRLYALARNAITEGQYAKAVALLTKLLEMKDHPYAQEAQEMLGLARERNGQTAHAKAEYETYLSVYPNTEGAKRVSQRLAGLLTASKTPKPSQSATNLDASTRTPRRNWTVWGTISQFYWHDTDFTEEEDDIVSVSELSSFVVAGGAGRLSRLDLRAQIALNDRRDFANEERDDTRLLDAFVDVADRRRGYFARAGRQTRSRGGVFGRFDGVLAGYNINNLTTVTGVVGRPVYSFESDDVERLFYGVSADLAGVAKFWDFGAFYLEQKADGVLDRRTVGGETRFTTRSLSLTGMVNYDLTYESVNIGYLAGSWFSRRGDTVYVTADYRNSPVVATANALQGLDEESIDELLDRLTLDEIRELARDRTSITKTYSVGGVTPLTRTLRLGADVTHVQIGATQSSEGVEGAPASEANYYLLQVFKDALVTRRDLAVLTARVSELSNTSAYSLEGMYRLLLPSWRIDPRLRFENRENSNSEQRNSTLMALRSEYVRNRHIRFGFELGAELTDEEFAEEVAERQRYYVNLGYYFDF